MRVMLRIYYWFFLILFQFLFVNAKYRIIFASYKPHVVCTIGDTDPNNFSGVDVMVLKDLFKEIGWDINDIDFLCAKYQTIYDLLEDPNSLFAIGGILIQKDFLNTNKFSQPYCNTGASIMVKGNYNAWRFADILDMWIVIWWLLTSLVGIAPLTYLFENGYYSLADYMYYEVYNLKFERGAEKRTVSGMLICFAQMTIAFMLILIFESFLIQALSIQTTITSEDKVIGKRIGTWSTYEFFADVLYAKYVKAEPDNPEDVNQLFHDPNLQIDGGLYDNWLLYIAERMYPDLYIVKANVIQYSFGLMFPLHISDEIVELMSSGIIKLTDKYPYEQRMIKFIESYYTLSTEEKMDLRINIYRFRDMYPMWIILCIGIACGGFIKIGSKIKMSIKKARKKKEFSKQSDLKYSITTKCTQPLKDKKHEFTIQTYNKLDASDSIANHSNNSSQKTLILIKKKTKIQSNFQDKSSIFGKFIEPQDRSTLKNIIDLMKNKNKKKLLSGKVSKSKAKRKKPALTVINPTPSFQSPIQIKPKKTNRVDVEISKSQLITLNQQLNSLRFSKRLYTYHYHHHVFSTREKMNKIFMKILKEKFKAYIENFTLNLIRIMHNKQALIQAKAWDLLHSR